MVLIGYLAFLDPPKESTDVFAKLTPDQKARVVSALRENGHTVGFMGDGINDAAAMKSADIGISVDTAVDVAKESADIILLEKDLMVLERARSNSAAVYGDVPGRLVCRIHVEPDSGYSHDPHTQTALPAQPCFRSRCTADIHRHCRTDSHSFPALRRTYRSGSTASRILHMAGRHHRCLCNIGNHHEKTVYP